MKKRVVILSGSLLLLCLATAFSQQQEFPARLQEKLNLYYERNTPVKIHASFNQQRYVPGDTVLCKIHFFSADNLVPVAGRQILTVQLLDMRSDVVYQTKVLLADGSGTIHVPIPDTALAGSYLFIAYNDAMKEYDTSLFFQSPLLVAGSKRSGPDTQDAFGFYPEGGHLIAGIANKIVVTGAPGSSGHVLAEEREVAGFRLNEQGLGLLFLTPDEDAQYAAKGELARTSLPRVEGDGIGLLVHVPSNGSAIRVTAQVPPRSALRAEKLFLSVTRHRVVYYTAGFSLVDRSFINFALPQEQIGEGIALITVFREDGMPLAERLVYIRDSKRASVGITFPKETFSVRDDIPVRITVKDSNGDRRLADLAVTVYREDDSESSGVTENLRDNALCFGDLSGSPLAGGDFHIDDSVDLLAMDHYLVTCRWRRFAWDDVWSERMRVNPFRNYLNLAGRALKRSGAPLPDSTLITFFLQKSVMTYVADVGPSGEFDLSLLMDFYGEEEIFYVVESRGRILNDIEIILHKDVPFTIQPHAVKTLAGDDNYFSFATKRRQIDRSYTYHMANRLNPAPPSLNALIEEEIFGADVAINLGDYYLFPTMSETLREIVPILQHRRQRSRDIVRLFFDDRDRFAEGEPLFVIDGVITDNTTYFLSLKPPDVVSIKIVHSLQKLQTFGSVGRNGIVLVETKIPGNASLVPRSSNTFRAVGLQTVSGVHPSRTASRSKRVPDLRTNLYWNPDLRTDASGDLLINIPASDATGTFIIKVEGFTEGREPLFAEDHFNIEFFD